MCETMSPLIRKVQIEALVTLGSGLVVSEIRRLVLRSLLLGVVLPEHMSE